MLSCRKTTVVKDIVFAGDFCMSLSCSSVLSFFLSFILSVVTSFHFVKFESDMFDCLDSACVVLLVIHCK